MAFVKLTQPDGTAVILNTDHVVQCAATPQGGPGAGPPGANTRISYVNKEYQDVTETIDTVDQRLKFH